MGRKRKLENDVKPDPKVRKLTQFMLIPHRNKVEDKNSVSADICVDVISARSDSNLQSCSSSGTSNQSIKLKSNHVRKFREEWRMNRSWLSYDTQSKSMFCSVCKEANVSNSFTIGCTVLKKENVTFHEKAKGKNSHTAAIELTKASKNYKKAAEVHLSKSETAVTAAMKNLFFLSDHNLPNMLISDFNNHCIDQGCSSLKALKVDKHTTYEHSTSVQEMQQCMVDVIHDDFISSIGNKNYSIMVDESTDVSVDQNMLIYVRYLEQTLGSFRPKSVLLDVCKLNEGATADKLHQTVLSSITDKKLTLSNLIGISTDGAAVMTGKKSGLVQRLKSDVPTLLSTHCIAHRLSLASGGAADSVPYLLKYQELVNSIYKYFDNSPKNMARLDKVHDVLKKGNSCVRFKQVFETRLLSFEGSVRAICMNYDALVSVLSEDKGAKAQGILKSVSCFKFLYTSHFLADVLKHLSILCKTFQSSSLDFTSVSSCLEVTAGEISKLTESKQGKMLKGFKSSVPKSVGCSGECQYKGHVIKDSEKQRKDAESACESFGRQVIVNLEERFADVGDSKILRAMSYFFDPCIFGRENELLDEYVECVSEFLGMEDFRDEYMMFQGEILANYAREAVDVMSFCQLALRKGDVYQCVVDVSYRLLCIPVSSVECERGFSVQNLIKTKLRNRLDTKSLYFLMKLQIDGGSQNSFDFSAAYGKWKSMKCRRICGY